MEQDPLVRRPVERHRRLGADPRHHRVGAAARHQGARPQAGPGVAAQPPPLPRRAGRRVRRRARRRDPARQLHRLRDHRRAGAVHRLVAPTGRRLGHRRHVPAGRDRDHVAAAPPNVEAGMACGAPAQLLPVRHHDRAHAHRGDRREGAGRVDAPRCMLGIAVAFGTAALYVWRNEPAAGGDPARPSRVPSAASADRRRFVPAEPTGSLARQRAGAVPHRRPVRPSDEAPETPAPEARGRVAVSAGHRIGGATARASGRPPASRACPRRRRPGSRS